MCPQASSMVMIDLMGVSVGDGVIVAVGVGV
jgi:hypothetical protein